MLLRTGEQIENDLFHIFETVELDYEITEEDDFGTFLTLSEILLLFEFQNSII